MVHRQEYLSPKEFAALMRVHVKTVLRWVRTGKLDGVRTVGGIVRIPARTGRKAN